MHKQHSPPPKDSYRLEKLSTEFHKCSKTVNASQIHSVSFLIQGTYHGQTFSEILVYNESTVIPIPVDEIKSFFQALADKFYSESIRIHQDTDPSLTKK